MKSCDFFDQFLKLSKDEGRKGDEIASHLKSEFNNDYLWEESLVKREATELQEQLLQAVPHANLENYNPELYAQLLPLMKLMHALENNGVAEDHAYKLSVLFEDEESALKYLREFLKKNPQIDQPLHEACNFALPADNIDVQSWRDLSSKFLLKEEAFRDLILPQAYDLENYIKKWQMISLIRKILDQSAMNLDNERQLDLESQSLDELKEIALQIIESKVGQEGYGKLSSPRGLDLQAYINALQRVASVYKIPKPTANDINEVTKGVTALNRRKKTLLSGFDPDIEKPTRMSREVRDEKTQSTEANLRQARLSLARLGVPFSGQLTIEALKVYHDLSSQESDPASQYMKSKGLNNRDCDTFHNLDRRQAGMNIPDVTLDGKDFDIPGFYLKKVDVANDMEAARAACFGRLTNCCQSIGDVGSECAIHGLTNPNGGFYVLCKGDVKDPKVTDEVYGQCWAWRGQSGGIVFDSIEVKNNDNDNDIDPSLLAHVFYNKLARELVEMNHTTRVSCGTGAGISKRFGVESILDENEEFVGYDGYNDSQFQNIICDTRPFLFCNNTINEETSIYIQNALLNNQDKKLNDIPEICDVITFAIGKNLSFMLEEVKNIVERHAPDKMEQLSDTIEGIEYYFNKNSHLNEVIKRIRIGFLPVDTRDLDRETTLMRASKVGELEFVSSLIDLKANINAVDDNRLSALAKAVEHGHTRVVECLVQNGADTNISLSNTIHDFKDYLSTKKEVILILIEHGIEANQTDKSGVTLLEAAIDTEHYDVALELVKNGASVDKVEPHHIAQYVFHNPPPTKDNAFNLILLLLQRGCTFNFDQCYSYSFNDEQLAEIIRNSECVDYEIMKLREFVCILGRENKTEALLALIDKNPNIFLNCDPMILDRMPNAKVLKKLLECGLQLNRLNEIKENPLMYSILRMDFESTKLCVDHHADLNVKDKNGNTPLMLAINLYESRDVTQGEILRFVSILLKEGADVTLDNNRGENALSLAEKWRLDDIADEIRKVTRGGEQESIKKESSRKLR